MEMREDNIQEVLDSITKDIQEDVRSREDQELNGLNVATWLARADANLANVIRVLKIMEKKYNGK